VVAQIRLALERVQRPGARVVTRRLDTRLRLGRLEQPLRAWVARELREVVQPDHRLQERVDHPQVRVERVDQVVRPGLAVDPNAVRRRLLEEAQATRRRVAVLRVAQQVGRASERLDRGRL
jgi:hypothetical protein